MPEPSRSIFCFIRRMMLGIWQSVSYERKSRQGVVLKTWRGDSKSLLLPVIDKPYFIPYGLGLAQS